MKEFRRATYITLVISFVMVLLQIASGRNVLQNNFLWIYTSFTFMYSYALYFANYLVFKQMDKRFGDKNFTPKRLLIGAVASFIASIFVVFLLRMLEEVWLDKKTIIQFLQEEKFSNYIVAITLTIIVTLAIHAFYFYKALQENKIVQQKVIAGNASAKFESLKNQIDPHFLFNSLNVLSSLIEENQALAQDFTVGLSKIYRYVLDQKDKELVPLAEELDFAETYMNLLKIRFENSLTYQIPTADELKNLHPEVKIVPLSLQLLLENAIKHNTVSEQKPLHITIYIKENQLVIQNNLQKKETLSNRKGVGLHNIVNRYALLTNRKVMVEETNQYFAVQLPLLTQKISFMNPSEFNENNAYLKAQQRVKELKEFYSNLVSYCVVIPFLIFINLRYSSNFQWFWFPMLGWGMGLVFHAFNTFGYGKTWEERKIKELMEKENQPQQKWN